MEPSYYFLLVTRSNTQLQKYYHLYDMLEMSDDAIVQINDNLFGGVERALLPRDVRALQQFACDKGGEQLHIHKCGLTPLITVLWKGEGSTNTVPIRCLFPNSEVRALFTSHFWSLMISSTHSD